MLFKENWKSHETHKYSYKMQSYGLLKEVVHMFTTGL
jgi:hypothetical protein